MLQGVIQDVVEVGGDTDIAVATTGTVYTHSFKLRYGEYFGLQYQATSSGDVDVTCTLELSHAEPATEGAASTSYVAAEGSSAIFSNLADENYHIITVSPAPMLYGRFKLVGAGTNDATTVMRMRLFLQEQI